MIEDKQKIIRIHIKGNIVVALVNLKKGTTISFEDKLYCFLDDIPSKYKFPLKTFKKGDAIYMYGVIVSKAKIDI